MRPKWYIGVGSGRRELFTSETLPTESTHGSDGAGYTYVIGPFRTLRGARFMCIYGQNNPHCQTVSQAETLGKKHALPSGRMRG